MDETKPVNKEKVEFYDPDKTVSLDLLSNSAFQDFGGGSEINDRSNDYYSRV